MEQIWRADEFYQEIPDMNLAMVTGQEPWKTVFQGCCPDSELEEWMVLPKTWLFLLTGGAGYGKTYLTRAFAGELGEQGYRFLRLYGADLQGETQNETIRRISGLLEELFRGDPVFLMLQALESLKEEAAWLELARGLEHVRDRDLPVVVAALTEKEEELSPYLRRIFQICSFSLPDKTDRTEYFRDCWENVMGEPETLSFIRMAELTEGLCYGQLEQIRLCVSALLRKKGLTVFKTPEGFRKAVETGRLRLTERTFRQAVDAIGKKKVPKEERKPEEERQAADYDAVKLTAGKKAGENFAGRGISDSIKDRGKEEEMMPEDISLEALFSVSSRFRPGNQEDD
ncbi:MAG: AAA family ATPase [Eubacteriales bacterium]|nr:AAA family ATPase [Eubacteriales bacterium]